MSCIPYPTHKHRSVSRIPRYGIQAAVTLLVSTGMALAVTVTECTVVSTMESRLLPSRAKLAPMGIAYLAKDELKVRAIWAKEVPGIVLAPGVPCEIGKESAIVHYHRLPVDRAERLVKALGTLAVPLKDVTVVTQSATESR